MEEMTAGCSVTVQFGEIRKKNKAIIKLGELIDV